MTKNSIHLSPWHLLGIPAGLLAIAMLPMPYGYYTFLRIAVTAGAVAWLILYSTRTLPVIVVAAVALLYNPVIPVHLAREIWVPVNVVTIVVLIATAATSKASAIQETAPLGHGE